jgi:sugar lactone lactonase YvrE
MRRCRLPASIAVLVLAVAAPAAAKPITDTGPNTETAPYVIPVAAGVQITSLLTVDDAGAASDGYELTGIPDGLGALKDGRHGFTLFMNHEFNATQGAVHRHGQIGAYVSNFRIDAKTLEVEHGADTIDPGVRFWNYVTQQYQTAPSPGGANPRNPADVFPAQGAAFARFCSGRLSAPGQFRVPHSSRGYAGQIYFANEENGDEGRLFGVLPDGTAQQLPRLGLFSWENTLPAYNRTETTLVIGDEDTAGGQLHVYEGTKRSRGNAFDRAGLSNGVHSVLDLVDETVSTDAQFRAKYGTGTPAEFDLAEVDWDQSGARQNAEAAVEGLSLNRIEDGTWDPRHPDTFYALTTEGGDTTPNEPGITRDGGGLWKVTFEDIERPRLGGTIELLLDGSEAPFLNKPDNMDIDRKGNLLIQEDPGNNAHLARIVAYDTHTGARGVVAEFDEDLFAAGSPDLITIDEESSGIIDAADVIGRGWFVFDAQVHKASPNPASVELGQLLAMKVKSFREVYDID